MRTSGTVLATLATSGLALLGGCASSDEGPGEEPRASASTGASEATPVSTETTTTTASAGAVTVPQDETEQLRNQKVAVIVQQALQDAAAALEKGNVEDARQILMVAYEVAPGDPRINALRDNIALRMGERPGEIGVLTRSAEDLERVRRGQVRNEVQNLLTESRRAREAGDMDNAIRLVERAMVIFRWNPYVSDVDETGLSEQGLRDRLDALRREKREGEREADARRRQLAMAEKEEKERAESDRVGRLKANFLRKANDAFMADRYREAVTFCDNVLDLDPNHTQATELREIANDSLHASLQRQYRSEFRYHWREIFDELEYDDLPQSELVTFPERREWQRIANRGPLQFSVGEQTTSAEDAKIYDILENSTIELNFKDTSLEDAIDWFRINTGANFIIDPIVMEEAADSAYDFSLSTMKVGKALDLLMSFATAEIKYVVSDGVVRIVSTEEATGGQILEFYDVRDLTQLIQSFPSRDFNLTPSNMFEDFEEDEIEPAPIVVDPDSLADLIRVNIDPESWDADPNNSINYISGALVVRQTPDVHRKIDSLLSDLRQNAGTMINVETRFLEMEDRFLQNVGVDFRGLDGINGSTATADVPNVILDDFGIPGSGGVGSPSNPTGIGSGNDGGAFFTNAGNDFEVRSRLENLFDLGLGDEDFSGTGGLAMEFTYLDDTQLEAVLRAVEKSSMAELINAQNLTVFNGQRANIIAQDHISYLADFEVEIAQGAVVADPVIRVLRDGTILDVRPVASADRRFVTMEVRPTLSNLIEPIQVFRTSLSIGNEVEIFLPELQIQRVRTTVTIPDGATLMLGGLKTITETFQESGMPFLKDIPLISFLTTRRGTEHSRERILILVRARILIPEEYEDVATP